MGDNEEICYAGVRTEIAQNPRTRLIVFILCSEIIMQTDGLSKMRATINGLELTNNRSTYL